MLSNKNNNNNHDSYTTSYLVRYNKNVTSNIKLFRLNDDFLLFTQVPHGSLYKEIRIQ